MRAFVVARPERWRRRRRLVHDGSGYAVVNGRIASAGKPVAEAEIRYRVVPFPNETLRAQMLETARRVAVPEAFLQWLSRSRCADHRDRPGLLPRRGRRRALGGAERRRRLPARWWTTATVRAVAGASDGAAGARQADPQARRPAADGGRGSASACYAAGPGAGLRRREGQRRRCCRRMDMIVAAGGGERDYAADEAILSALPPRRGPRRAAERASAVRPAPDLVPGAAFQSAGRQHLDRARRGRLVAHLHGRGSRRRRRRAHRLRAHRRRPGRDLFLVGGSYNARAAGRAAASTRWAGCSGSSHFAAGLGAPGATAAAWCWARSAASW